ncbi:MAG: NUDIX domain-containing protein [Oscillospiraceae bacterium]|nr:NUDIX domain-containing protein [Oscillospiraceae bacterium]
MRNSTLCYIERGGSYLMLHRVKKENDVNRDKWIGIGGGFEEGESPEECVLREIKEETGLTVTGLRLRGIVTFVSDRWETEYMHLFTAFSAAGDTAPCDEGELEWIEKSRLFSLPIWEGDKIFLDLIASDHPFFSLKLAYEGDRLVSAALDGKKLGMPTHG